MSFKININVVKVMSLTACTPVTKSGSASAVRRANAYLNASTSQKYERDECALSPLIPSNTCTTNAARNPVAGSGVEYTVRSPPPSCARVAVRHRTR